MCPVPVPSCGAGQHRARRVLDDGPGREAERGVEVPLYRMARPDAAARLVERDAPVDADHVGPRRAHEPEQFTGAHTEEDGGHAEVGDPLEHGAGGGKGEAGVLVG